MDDVNVESYKHCISRKKGKRKYDFTRGDNEAMLNLNTLLKEKNNRYSFRGEKKKT